MLKLRPNCEGCNCDRPPDSAEVMICTHECTCCQSCVEAAKAFVSPIKDIPPQDR